MEKTLERFLNRLTSMSPTDVLDEISKDVFLTDEWVENKVSEMIFHAAWAVVEKGTAWDEVLDDIRRYLDVMADKDERLLADWLGSHPLRFSLAEEVAKEMKAGLEPAGSSRRGVLYRTIKTAQMRELDFIADRLVDWVSRKFAKFAQTEDV